MTAYSIKFNHSAMRPGFRGHAIKHASSPKEAADFLGKYSARTKTIIDKRGSVLSNVEIKEL